MSCFFVVTVGNGDSVVFIYCDTNSNKLTVLYLKRFRLFIYNSHWQIRHGWHCYFIIPVIACKVLCQLAGVGAFQGRGSVIYTFTYIMLENALCDLKPRFTMKLVCMAWSAK